MIIPNSDLIQLRHLLEQLAKQEGYSINYVKATANSAFQAIEDWFVLGATQTAISNAINTATTPVVLSVTQKKIIGKAWLDWKARNT